VVLPEYLSTEPIAQTDLVGLKSALFIETPDMSPQELRRGLFWCARSVLGRELRLDPKDIYVYLNSRKTGQVEVQNEPMAKQIYL